MVDKKKVEYVANLARIEVSSDEIDSLGEQFTKIINYIDKLNELDVDGVEPMRGLHPESGRFREDKVKKIFERVAILKNIPVREGDYFKIPKVIE